MRVIEIDTRKIKDWNSFHAYFKEIMGFPESYAENMDAWISCMSDIDRSKPGMTKILIKPGETLTIKLFNAADFKERCPDQLQALLECSAFVNMRKIENDANTRISIALY
ncbi:MAG: barstar family protein [Spirochaetes bacterium]|nr:barstar family protein [Spirochaetota bacterium]